MQKGRGWGNEIRIVPGQQGPPTPVESLCRMDDGAEVQAGLHLVANADANISPRLPSGTKNMAIQVTKQKARLQSALKLGGHGKTKRKHIRGKNLE